jgi:hypothetical protein
MTSVRKRRLMAWNRYYSRYDPSWWTTTPALSMSGGFRRTMKRLGLARNQARRNER